MNLNPFENRKSKELEKKTHLYYDYNELVESITGSVNWTILEGYQDYQGDYFCLGEDIKKRVYFLDFGYGSCSGCDSLQACTTYEEVVELRDDFKRNIKQFDTIQEFETWFNDIGQTNWWNSDDIRSFIEAANEKYHINLTWRK